MTTAYARRLNREHAVPPTDRTGAPILSENPKTGVSLNLPVANCQPSPICAGTCYACRGPIAFRDAIVKAVSVDRLCLDRPVETANRIAREARGRPIRLNGSGDLTPKHTPFLRALLAAGVQAFGFTRRPDTWRAARRIGLELMFSIDASTPARIIRWARRYVPVARIAYLRRASDPDRSDTVGVTFPDHSAAGRADTVSWSITDCPAVRHKVPDCSRCRRCW